MNGYGALHYNNGNSWEGEFKDHKKNGIGLLKTNTGDYLLCEFENDVLKGKVPLSGDEVEFFKHRGEKMRGIQDQYILGLIEPSTLDKERKEYLDEMRKVYDYKTNPNAIAPAFMDVKRKKTKNERANPVPFERFESDLSMGDGENFEVKDKETERKEKLEKEQNKTKNPFMYEQLRDMCPNLGIDIKADRTTIVKASEEGTVTSIKNDPRYGLSIVIEHVNGFKTVYSNLLTTEFVAEGEKVEKGQSIGTVGNSASFEIVDEPHLHFEIIKDGENVDPNIYLK